MTGDNWRKETVARMLRYHWDNVLADDQPFIEKQQDSEMLTKDNLIKLLEGKG